MYIYFKKPCPLFIFMYSEEEQHILNEASAENKSNIKEAMARLLFYLWQMWNRGAMLSWKTVWICGWRKLVMLCTKKYKMKQWHSPHPHEPVFCLTLSLTCDSWASIVRSQCLSLHDWRPLPSDYIKWWHGKLHWAWVCMHNVLQ